MPRRTLAVLLLAAITSAESDVLPTAFAIGKSELSPDCLTGMDQGGATSTWWFGCGECQNGLIFDCNVKEGTIDVGMECDPSTCKDCKNTMPSLKQGTCDTYASANGTRGVLFNLYEPTKPLLGGYVVYPAPKNAPIQQSVAAELCEERGGYLGTVTSLEDEKQVGLALDKVEGFPTGPRGWVTTGGSDAKKEGTWVWKYGPPEVMGKTIWSGGECQQDHCNWQPGEPNGVNSETVLVIDRNAMFPGWNKLGWVDVAVVNGYGGSNAWYLCQFTQSAASSASVLSVVLAVALTSMMAVLL